MWKIYKIDCTASRKSYIGITKTSTKARWTRHRYVARQGSPIAISRAIRKYGFRSFKIRLLEIAETFEEAAAIERQMIVEHATMWPHGYNLTSGGEATLGRVVSAEARSRMSEAAKARDPATRKMSLEARRACSESRKVMLQSRHDLRNAIGEWNRGKRREISEDERRRISATLKRYFRTNPNQLELPLL